MLSTHHAVHSKAYFAHGRLRRNVTLRKNTLMHAQDESVESERRAEEKRQILHDKMVHGDEVHIREGHANDETPHTYCGVLNVRRICAHPAPGMHHRLRLALRTLCACAVGESST